MKVIDLYVMLSKGEQPKKFKYRDEWYAYSIDDYDFRTLKQEYRDADVPTYQYLMEIIDASNLNDEVEIIEEDKKIKKLPYYDYKETMSENNRDKFIEKLLEKHDKRLNDYHEKINEIIDYINGGTND